MPELKPAPLWSHSRVYDPSLGGQVIYVGGGAIGAIVAAAPPPKWRCISQLMR